MNTNTTDITGQTIRVGDTVTHDYAEVTTAFEVVWEHGEFRKEYPNWPKGLPKPLLETGEDALRMRFKILCLPSLSTSE